MTEPRMTQRQRLVTEIVLCCCEQVMKSFRNEPDEHGWNFVADCQKAIDAKRLWMAGKLPEARIVDLLLPLGDYSPQCREDALEIAVTDACHDEAHIDVECIFEMLLAALGYSRAWTF